MQNSVVDELNTLLKGELMAVESYENFINAAQDEDIKNALKDIQNDHKMHADELSQRIQSLGGKAHYSTGITGLIAGMKQTLEGLNNQSSLDIMKKALDGEDKGIAAAEKSVKGDLDEESMKIVNNMLSQDHDHLKKMAGIITDFETRH